MTEARARKKKKKRRRRFIRVVRKIEKKNRNFSCVASLAFFYFPDIVNVLLSRLDPVDR